MLHRFVLRAVRTRISAIACLLMAVAAHAQTVHYVDDDAPQGGDGLSWHTAFADLHEALAIAQAGDEIRIAHGTYTPAPPNGPRDATFELVDGITLRGGYAGRGAPDPNINDPKTYPSILSGDLNGDDTPNWQNRAENSFNVVTGTELGSGVNLQGLIIRDGNANVSEKPWCAGTDTATGGGMKLISCTLYMSDCIVQHCSAFCSGGGLHLVNGHANLVRCRFIANRAIGSGAETYGGAIFSTASTTFSDCQFLNNESHWYYGAIYAGVNGAMFRNCQFIGNTGGEIIGAIAGSNLVIVNCIFDQNTSSHWVSCVSCTHSVIVNSRFTRSSANICGISAGTALRMSNTHVVNCAFVGNEGGIAAVAASGESHLIDCTLIGNEHCGPPVYVFSNSTLQVRNSVIWDNSIYDHEDAPPAIWAVGQVQVSNSCLQHWSSPEGGPGNHGNDPRFIDADGPDNIYGTEDDNPRLLANSPLINRGDNAALPQDAFDLDGDGDTQELMPIDLDRLPRIVHGVVDVGAYEFQGIPCLADISGDGSVNVNDLLAVINTWGACVPGEMCNADLTLDGAVNVNDLLLVINGWGACPSG